jgi:anaerobic magnesium-protoporphyrin IX monomethyl ester cyclase
MECTLINPYHEHVIKRTEGFSFQYNKKVQPLCLAYIAALLRKEKIKAKIIDANIEAISPKSEFWSTINSEIVVLTTAQIDNWQCPYYELDLIKEIRYNLPKKTKVIITGPHGTANAEEIMKVFGNDVIVVRGEPEFTTLEIVKKLIKGKDFSDVDGISFYNKEGKLIHKKPAEMFNINNLPIPAYDLLPMEKYHYEIMGDNFSLIESSRGCPYKCNFCLKNMYRDVYKNRDPKTVVEEIKYLQKNFNVKNLFFIDLEFTIRKWDTINLCKEIVKQGVKISYAIQARADKVDDETLYWLKKSGCSLIHFGVESGNPNILAYTNKMITLDKIDDGVARTKKAGIKTLCFFILGHAPETREQIIETINFAKKLNPDYASFVVLIPYAGTPIHNPEGKSQFFYLGGSNTLSLQDLEKLRRRAIREFYIRPRYIASRISQVRSLEDIKVLWRGFNDLFIPLVLNR